MSTPSSIVHKPVLCAWENIPHDHGSFKRTAFAKDSGHIHTKCRLNRAENGVTLMDSKGCWEYIGSSGRGVWMGLNTGICSKFVEETVRSPHFSRKWDINSLELLALGSDIAEDRGHSATPGTEGQSIHWMASPLALPPPGSEGPGSPVVIL